MVSRRKILSRSRDELHSDIYFMNEDDDEDIWYSKEKLYRVGIILFSKSISMKKFDCMQADLADLLRDDFLREKFSKLEFDTTKSALAVEQ